MYDSFNKGHVGKLYEIAPTTTNEWVIQYRPKDLVINTIIAATKFKKASLYTPLTIKKAVAFFATASV